MAENNEENNNHFNENQSDNSLKGNNTSNSKNYDCDEIYNDLYEKLKISYKKDIKNAIQFIKNL